MFDLQYNVAENHEKGVGEVEEEPDLNWLDVGGGGQTGRDRQVDSGKHHHAGDVDGVDQVVLAVSGDVVGGLVDQVHQDGGQVGHYEDTSNFSFYKGRVSKISKIKSMEFKKKLILNFQNPFLNASSL